ncbi:DUF2637 domain-containing protein [Streptomyces cinereoruber]|uniref:DUF2637 domain-containing protein n=1 Tax=Streptomyces cinereoruber TaxID=67260 RepID=UPI003631A865
MNEKRLMLRKMSAWDRAAIILLGATGFAFSYDALRQVAIAIHARPELSYLFPVFIDGFIAYGVRALVILRHSGFGARLYAWILFLAATGSSLWANALHAITLNHGPRSEAAPLHLGDGVVGVLSTLAPLALAGSVHLYIIMARTAESSVPDRPETRPGPVPNDVRASGPRVMDAPREHRPKVSEPVQERSAVAGPSATPDAGPYAETGRTAHTDMGESPAPPHPADADSPLASCREHVEHPPRADEGQPAVRDESRPWEEASGTTAAAASEPPAEDRSSSDADGEETSVQDDAETPADREVVDEWLTHLLPVAREAARQAGRISRDAIKEAVRALQPISNDRLGELVTALKMEEQGARTPPADSPKPLW